MSNTLTGLIPTIYTALDVVSREMTGLVPSVSLFPSAEQAALNQTITYPVAGSMTAADIVPAATGPDPSAQTIGTGSLSITKNRGVTFFWEGDEELSLGDTFNATLQAQFAQAMRTLVNEIEADLAALYVSASRATGTAGTTPFASDLSDSANLRKILADNGAPLSDLSLVVDTSAGTNLRTLAQLNKANEAGTAETLRRGVLMDVHGFAVRESAQVKSHTKGTGSGYLVNNAAGYSVGDTTIAVDTGSGTILAGDVVTFAGDSNKYLVTTALAGGNFTIAEPGLRQSLADNTAVTVGNGYSANLAFARSAIHLVTRTPAVPSGGDAADDRMTVTDPVSGLSLGISLYRQYKRVSFEVGAAWGVKAVKPEHMAILLG